VKNSQLWKFSQKELILLTLDPTPIPDLIRSSRKPLRHNLSQMSHLMLELEQIRKEEHLLQRAKIPKSLLRMRNQLKTLNMSRR